MAIMGRYCKAYPLAEICKYKHLDFDAAKVSELMLVKTSSDNNPALVDSREIVYLQENYTVTKGVFKDEDIIFGDVNPQWIEFCHKVLSFKADTGKPT